ncbi:hypothetical protein IW261DRAFT_1510732 [Armillaria novae-zelandiae]|uniref:F-box domain-containing protein n=1 Tax=Armillaria novae-zelandiae TaxID=153914 RepID=A0AA39NU27_9AGAR|nr:hypothetical protein IW261DRAFT_1510732 [Armillaria novae-zelandiae]
MDICPHCEFGAIRPYTTSVNALELIQSGFSSLDICKASVLNDIANLEQELQHIESLIRRIGDRREKIAGDIDCCKALIAPIGSLPQETLLHIFSLASSVDPNPHGAPWILGHVCSSWRSISRSCPSLWANLHISDKYSECLPFLEKYISLSCNVPIHLSLDDVDDYGVWKIAKDLIAHSDRWLTLGLCASGSDLSELLSLSSSSPNLLTRLYIENRYDDTLDPVTSAKFFSSSPITELDLDSPDSADIYSIFQRVHNLLQLYISPSPDVPPRNFTLNSSSTQYPLVRHTSLQALRVAITFGNEGTVTALPQIFDSVYLPALYQFSLALNEKQRRLKYWLDKCTPIECSSLIDLFRRSQCTIFYLTFSIPISVENLLIPILKQSGQLRTLEIFVNAEIARDVFRALSLEQGMAPYLKGLCIRESPFGKAKCGLLEAVDEFHAMVLSRTEGGGRLKTLTLSLEPKDHTPLLPVAQSSSFHNLFAMKERGMEVVLLLDGKDCLVDEDARVRFFGPAQTSSSFS